MTRRPSRRSGLLKNKPITFSPFARSSAHVALARNKASGSNSFKKSNQDSTDISFTKQHVEEKNEESDSSEGEESDGIIQADFEFFDPKPEDFHGVKILLQTFLDDKQWDLSGFVDLILGQPTVGTVVKVDDGEDNGLFSVVTALNLGRYKGHKCITELKDFLSKACQEKALMANLSSFFEEKAQDVGLLVSQSVLNLPPQLLPPLYDGLFDEVLWATEDEPTKELQNSFRFKFYMIVSKIYKLKNADQRKKSRIDNDEEIIYIKPEDEIFHNLSSWSFTFPLHAQVTTNELRNYRLMGLVMAIEAKKIPSFQKELKSFIDES